MRIAATTAFAVLAATTAFAQDEPARRVATEVAARVPLERATKGAPYSAETVVEGNQALADGNKISTRTTGRVYRDSEGRTRREEDRKNGTVTISINDPVGGYSYSLDAVNKIAWRTPSGVGGAIMGKLEAAQAEGRRIEAVRSVNPDGTPVVSIKESPLSDEEKQRVEAAAAKARIAGAEDAQSKAAPVAVARGGGGGVMVRRAGPEAPLEHKTIDGVAVEGRTTRTVVPAGQVGNEQPITIVDEQWRSADLNVLVLTRHADPRTGESSYRLLNIIRAEPDPSVFMVPPDYTVKDSGIRKMIPQ